MNKKKVEVEDTSSEYEDNGRLANMSEHDIDMSKLYSKDGVELDDNDLYFLAEGEMLFYDPDGSDFNYGHIMSKYKILEKLGQGGFGSVYKAVERKSGNMLAVKIIELDDYMLKASKVEEIYRESKALK